MNLREKVIEEARSWCGTPFHHQAFVKDVGVDCIMLVRHVGENSGAMDKITPKQEQRFWQYYGRRPNPKRMRECLSTFLIEIQKGEAGLGDITWSHWGNKMPIHMGIISEFEGRPTVIHAVWPTNVHEHTLGEPFLERVTAYWRYPRIT